ncbi:hypothetical protein B0H14DRAFT_526468 [Mycena olivaceomarginata]|nr:hypothetical protein B0H14DRAFT_526468 [Mycena olivaceomarginata]
MGNMSGSSNMNTALKLSLYFLKALAWANRGPILFFRVYIDSKMVKTRVDLMEGRSSSSADSMMSSALASVGRKRTLSSTSEGANRKETAIKCPAPMKSAFVPMNSTLQMLPPAKPSLRGLRKASLAPLNTRTSVKGAIKSAYHFKTRSGQALVAKCFYRVSEGDENKL